MKKRGRIVAFFLIVLAIFGMIGTTVTGIAKDINLGLDLQGGFEVLYEVEPVEEGAEVTRSLLEGTVDTLNNRVNGLGISEATINIEGENRIRVQLAGVGNQEEARELLSTSAQLTFRDVNDNTLLDGTDIVDGSARQDFDPNTNQPLVTLQLEDPEKFGDVTEQINEMTPPNNRLVIWMDYQEGDSYEEEVTKEDPKFVSAPAVDERLNTSSVQITGNFTVESAQQLADIINSGSLQVNLNEIYSTSVGAQFGEQALDKTVFAGFVGIGIIFLFMMAVYRFPGIIAAINLSLYIFLVLLVFELLNGVLTLPGIAALILGVGMAVDANIITFERIKEELREGKSVVASFKNGTKNSLSTILDANITTLLAAAILFIFGTSAVKGFATMLIISIVVSFITAVYGTRLLLGLWVKSKALNKRKGWFGVKQDQIKDIKDSREERPVLMFNRELRPVDHRRKYFIGSLIMVIIGTVSFLLFQINPGVDFTSGSRVQVVGESTIDTEEVEAGFDEMGLSPVSIVLSGDNNEMAVARFDTVLSEERVAEVQSYFGEQYGTQPSVSTVSSIVGEELVKNAIYAVSIAAAGMILYVAMRFEFYFAITAIIALLHNVFFTLAVFSVLQIEFDVTIIAAILTIIGYSINDTIVIFDRIRENLRFKKKVTSFKELANVVNRSLLQSFARSINTTITTLTAVVAFLILGAQPITGFAIALLVGLLAGSYSSLFIAAQFWLVWRGKMIKKKPVDFTKKKRVEGPQV